MRTAEYFEKLCDLFRRKWLVASLVESMQKPSAPYATAVTCDTGICELVIDKNGNPVRQTYKAAGSDLTTIIKYEPPEMIQWDSRQPRKLHETITWTAPLGRNPDGTRRFYEHSQAF